MGFSEKISRKYFEGGPCIGRHVSPYSYTPTPYLCKSVGEAGGGVGREKGGGGGLEDLVSPWTKGIIDLGRG